MKSIRIGNDIRIEWPIVLSGDVSKLQDLDLTVEVRPSAKIIDTHNYADETPDEDKDKRPVFIKTETTVMMNGGITCRPDIGDGKEHCRPRPCPPHPHRPVPPAPVRLPYHIEDNTLIAMWTADRQFATGDYDIILYAHKNEGGQAVCDQYRFVRLVSHTAQADAPDDSGIEAVIAMQPVTLELSGLSAYEVAVANGFQGTEKEWLQSLKQPAIDAAEQAKEDIEKYKTETKAELKADIDYINSNIGIDEYPEFSEREDYLAGNVVIYQGKLYRFTSDHPKGAWLGTDVKKTNVVKTHIVQEFGDDENAVISQKVMTDILNTPLFTYPSYNTYIKKDSTFALTGKSYLIPIETGDVIRAISQNLGYSYIALLKSGSGFDTLEGSPDFCDSYNERIEFSGSKVLVAPSDASYLYVMQANESSASWIPTTLFINSLDVLNGLTDSLKGLETLCTYDVSKNHPTEGIDGTNKYTLEAAINKVPARYCIEGLICSFMNSRGFVELWMYIGGGNYNAYRFVKINNALYNKYLISSSIIDGVFTEVNNVSLLIPCKSMDLIRLNMTSVKIAFLKGDVVLDSAPDYCVNTEFSTTYNFNGYLYAPSDAKYLYIEGITNITELRINGCSVLPKDGDYVERPLGNVIDMPLNANNASYGLWVNRHLGGFYNGQTLLFTTEENGTFEVYASDFLYRYDDGTAVYSKKLGEFSASSPLFIQIDDDNPTHLGLSVHTPSVSDYKVRVYLNEEAVNRARILGLSASIEELRGDVLGMYPKYATWITTEGTYRRSTNDLCCIIPIKGGDVVRATNSVSLGGARQEAYIAFLKDLSNIETDGAVPSFCDGYDGRIVLSTDTFTKYAAPNDASYLYVGLDAQTTGYNWKPYKIQVNNVDLYKNVVDNVVGIADIATLAGGLSISDTEKTQYFNVPMVVPQRDFSDPTAYIEPIQTYVRGLLRLPPNYTTTGKPVPLVIWFSGSGVFGKNTSADFGKRKPFIDYLCKEGFAVCCSMSKPQYFDQFGWQEDFGTPSNYAAVLAVYDYVTQNYNVSRTNVFAAGKSRGGSCLMLHSYYKHIPIKAAVNLCACVENTFLVFGYGYEQQLTSIKEFGFSEEFISLFKEQAKKTGNNARPWSGTLEEKFQEECNEKMNGYALTVLGTDLQPTVAKDTLWTDNSYIRHWPTPTLFFTAADDGRVQPEWIESFYKSCLRGNSLVYLIKYPSGLGNHFSVDGSNDGWYENEEAFKAAASSLGDGLYTSGLFWDNPKWWKITDGSYQEVSATEDPCPKEDITTLLGYECKNVTQAWPKMVQFFREFMVME